MPLELYAGHIATLILHHQTCGTSTTAGVYCHHALLHIMKSEPINICGVLHKAVLQWSAQVLYTYIYIYGVLCMKCGAPYTNPLHHLHMECYRCKFRLYMQIHCSLHKCGASRVLYSALYMFKWMLWGNLQYQCSFQSLHLIGLLRSCDITNTYRTLA